MDYVFPWVNPFDPKWKESFERESKRVLMDVKEPNERFRELGLLKYHLRSIAKNMPWIDRVVILVSSLSQVPDWMNTDCITFVVHRDFIPQQFLPCFNSNTIEMFLGNLPVSEEFIYANDDCFVINPCEPTDFFENGKAKTHLTTRQNIETPFRRLIKRTFDTVREDSDICMSHEYLRPGHYQVPMYLSACEEVLSKYQKPMYDSISTFRNLEINLNQYIYSDYMRVNGLSEEAPRIGKYFNLAFEREIAEMIDVLRGDEFKIICANDTGATNADVVYWVDYIFKTMFPDKCKYEK